MGIAHHTHVASGVVCPSMELHGALCSTRAMLSNERIQRFGESGLGRSFGRLAGLWPFRRPHGTDISARITYS